MSGPEGALDWLRARIGMAEEPVGSNCNEISRWAGLGCVPWCAEAVSEALVKGGVGDGDRTLADVGPRPDYRWGWAYCPSIVNAFRAAGRFDRSPRVGDFVLFDWQGDGISDHVGMVESLPGDGTIVTLEGNTSDALLRRRRTMGVILGFAHIAYAEGVPPSPPEHPAPSSGEVLPLQVDGDFGPPQRSHPYGVYHSCMALQRVLGIDDDGRWGPQTVRATQGHVKAKVDGVWGPKSNQALQRRVNVIADGQFGRNTAGALQRALNIGSF